MCALGFYTFINCKKHLQVDAKIIERENRTMATKKAAKKAPAKKAAKKKK
jgi:hypothetical protein